MDLKKFDSITQAEKGVELILAEKVGDDPGAALLLYGGDSSACREIDRELARRNSDRKGRPRPDELTEQVLEKLAACTKGWRGLEEDGAPLEFSQKAAMDLYRRYPEIADRASRFIFDRTNFFPTASMD